MKTNEVYSYIHKQIPVMMFLSLLPGLGYIFLGWLSGNYIPAVFWYISIVLISIWGYRLYKNFDLSVMSNPHLISWYNKAFILFYLFFIAWLAIFLIYISESESGMHYIAIFTEIGASTVAAALLFPDKKLYKPIIVLLITPLVLYFPLLETWYGYVLTAFSAIFGWVLMYVANSSNDLFTRTIFQSTHDYLTGLYNRQYFIEYLQKKMNELSDTGHYSYLLLIDLDHFKTVNDSLGHDIGDQLLKEVVDRMKNNLSPLETICRLGGDEFIINGESFRDKKECKRKALEISERLLSLLKVAYVIDNHNLYISASIGVSLMKSSEHSSVDFIKEADIAMYEVKEKGRDGVFFFDEEMSERVERNLMLERLMHSAVKKQQIKLAYQAQVDEFDKIIGVEVLARWSNDELGQIPPVEFIAIAEKTGLIIELGGYILETAFSTLREWNERGIEFESFSINLSVRQLKHYSFIEYLKMLYDEFLDENLAKKVIFEITESVMIDGVSVVKVIEEIKKLGIRFSMDDFGTGYSSLSYIRQLPIDEIKIDRLFIKDLSKHTRTEEMVSTIFHIAKVFNLMVVAEGVETEEQKKLLITHGCKIFQGYLYSKPIYKGEFEKFYFDR